MPDEKKGAALVSWPGLSTAKQTSAALRQEIKETVVRLLGKTLRPEEVHFVGELPKTRNAKVVRRLIRAKYLGLAQLGDTSSLERPEALEEIAQSR